MDETAIAWDGRVRVGPLGRPWLVPLTARLKTYVRRVLKPEYFSGDAVAAEESALRPLVAWLRDPPGRVGPFAIDSPADFA